PAFMPAWSCAIVVSSTSTACGVRTCGPGSTMPATVREASSANSRRETMLEPWGKDSVRLYSLDALRHPAPDPPPGDGCRRPISPRSTPHAPRTDQLPRDQLLRRRDGFRAARQRHQPSPAPPDDL